MSKLLNKTSKRIRNLVFQLIRHHYPRKKIRLEPLGGGLTNHVFLVFAGKEQIVVRINEEGDKINHFLKEQWAVTKARERKIPVPEILEVGNTVIPLPYMISAKVEGVVALNHPERKSILFQTGNIAAIIHEIKTSGYGRFFDWSSNILSKNVGWKDFIEGELDLKNRLAILKKHRMLPAASLKKLGAEFQKIMSWKSKPCLQHGDLRLKNVMVDKNGKITAIIDWEECISAIGPAWDLSIALHDLPIEGQHRFLEGYGLKDKELHKLSTTLKAFNILNYAPTIQMFADQNKKNELSCYRTRLHGLLDLYSI